MESGVHSRERAPWMAWTRPMLPRLLGLKAAQTLSITSQLSSMLGSDHGPILQQ